MVGTAMAMRILAEDPEELDRVGAIATEFRERLVDGVDDLQVFGDPDNCLPNTVGVGFGGVEGHLLMMALDLKGICVSTGSACHTGATKPSHVLSAMNVDDHFINGTIRFSFGRLSRPEHAQLIADAVAEAVATLRKGSSVAAR